MRCEDDCPESGRPGNGNCVERDPADGLAIQCVGDWVLQKHEPLRNYIDATWAARRRFIEPSPGIPVPGGAAYIDLFAGPGRCRVRSRSTVIDGSPLLALQHGRAPFTKVILCEIDPENVAALRKRTAPYGSRALVIPGDCHANVDRVAAAIPPQGLNLAFVDPYALDQLRFETLARLASFERMDLLIHFPTMDLKRTIGEETNVRLADALGTQGLVRKAQDVTRAIDDLRTQLRSFGYTGRDVRDVPVTNRNNTPLYHLVYVSKHDLGDEIWQSVVRSGKQQLELFR